MFNNFVLGKYYPADSLIHRMNSFNKLLCVLTFLIGIMIINQLILYIMLIIFTLIIIIISKVPFVLFLSGLKKMSILMAVVFLFELLFSFNVVSAFILVIRIILIVIYTSILTYTTTPNEITYAFEQLLSPLKAIKVPVTDLAFLLSLSLRFVPLTLEQANKILKSQASRGIDFKHSNIKGKIVALSSMLVPMIILSLKRAEKLADVMEVRLYGVEPTRTYYRLNKWTKEDNTIFTFHLGFLIVLIICEVVML
ncbi:MAG: energy-coupling factor transporter transmembrane component T family protein [Bacilli bacterium]|jgi:energy-coupling factor transport system permease protein|nr:energy-coupling factor transporter transmembrane protein EcfT [Bacilli bacterium]